jgi:hypothetical protein
METAEETSSDGARSERDELGDGVDSDDLLYLRRDAHEHSDSSDSGTDADRPEEDDDEAASAVLRELHDDVKVSATSESPFHALDAETQKVVRKLRLGSLLPHGVDRNSGEATAAAWCAFESCSANGPPAEWVAANPTRHARDWLAEHVHTEHLADLADMFNASERCLFPNQTSFALTHKRFEPKFMALYTKALREAQRGRIPDVGPTVNRRCVEEFYAQFCDEKIESLICFSCSQVFVRDEADTACSIQYRHAVPDRFLGLSAELADKALKALSRSVYDARYTKTGFVDDEDKAAALRGWTVAVPTSGGAVDIICCPEDRKCAVHDHGATDALCESCEIPLCSDCCKSLESGKMPKFALANDNWHDFMLKYIFEERVTYAELVAASVVHPTIRSVQINVQETWKQVNGAGLMRECVHDHRGTLGSIGAVTAYVLGFEAICAQIDRATGVDPIDEHVIQLPQPPAEVAATLQFRLYAVRDFWTGKSRDRLLREATVRKEVVVRLIEMNVARNLPGYAEFAAKTPNWRAEVVARAAALYPTADPIADVFSVYEINEEVGEVDEGKAACPAQPLTTGDVDPLAHAQTMGICDGASMHAGMTDNERTIRGLMNLQDEARGVADGTLPHVHALRYTHEELLETFNPWFFAIAYPFLYPRGGGWVDYYRNPSSRRSARTPTDGDDEARHTDAPRVELDDLARWMCRTAMNQFKRDCTHLFVFKDLWHRRQVNHAKGYHVLTNEMSSRVDDGNEGELALQLVEDIHDLLSKLTGSYSTDLAGVVHVGGDVGRLRSHPDLTPLQRKLLVSFDLVARRISGTAEARHMMLKYSEGFVVRYGQPFMLTISPNPYQSMLVCHLHRGLKADPLYLRDVELAGFISKDKPSLKTFHRADGSVSCGIFVPLDHPSLEGFQLPSFDARQRIVAQDPLASVHAFRCMVMLLVRTMLGCRICSDCPWRSANCSCQDMFGSVANAEGGVFGMVEAYAGSIEAQNFGALHVHILLWLNWVFQRCTIVQIARMLLANLDAASDDAPSWTLDDVRNWKERCVSETLPAQSATAFTESVIDDIESQWTTRHCDDAGLFVHGHSPEVAQMDAPTWCKWFNRIDTIRRMLCNLHVHPKNADGERSVPRSCLAKAAREVQKRQRARVSGRKLSESDTCKYMFPKKTIAKPTVICVRWARKFGWKTQGDRSAVGMLDGPRIGYKQRNGHLSAFGIPLGECHPAINVVLGSNSHVRDTSRLPPIGKAHAAPECSSRSCRRRAATRDTIRSIIRSAGRTAKLIVRYTCSYHAKACRLAQKRVETFGKMHDHRLQEFLAQGDQAQRNSLAWFTRRAVMRLLSDAITNSRTMFMAEGLNLMAYSDPTDATRAESFYSAPSVLFPCQQLRAEFQRVKPLAARVRMKVQKMPQGDAKLLPDASNHFAFLYGLRPEHDAVWLAPPYLVWTNWYWCRTTVARTVAGNDKPNTHCKLTELGLQYVRDQGADIDEDFLPGVHYEIRGEAGCANGQQWLALHPNSPDCWRHEYVLVRHDVPHVPWFRNPYAPHNDGEMRAHAKFAYFAPWTSIESAATAEVPYAPNVKTGAKTYKESWREYINRGVPCKDVKHFIEGFEAIYDTGAPTLDADEDEDGWEDTSRLEKDDLTKTSLHTTTKNGVAIDVRVWDQAARKSEYPTISGRDTRRAVDFRTAPKPRKRKEDARHATPKINNFYEFYTVNDAPSMIQAWREKRATEAGRRIATQEDFVRDFTDCLIERACTMRRILNMKNPPKTEAPPLFFVTGPPGTGKSFSTQALRSLFSDLGWEENKDYQFCAFQAATALQCGGRTVHHVCNRNRNGAGGIPRLQGNRLQVLVVEEISMLEAVLLDALEAAAKLAAEQAKSPFRMHPFGGVIVVFTGDFNQLPPAGGTTLDSPLRLMNYELRYSQRVRSGLKILWDNDNVKLYELSEQVRCRDEWWASIWADMRRGTLSRTDISFMKGEDTDVPGSFMALKPENAKERVLCKQAACLALAGASPATIRTAECAQCKSHRDARHVVRRFTPSDERWRDPDFDNARFLSLHNDRVYGNGLARSLIEAARLGQRFVLSIAHDVILYSSSMKNQRRIELKKSWLDVDASKAEHLGGKVPIYLGATVRLSKHMENGDREEYGLTKDRQGTIVGWECDVREPEHTPDTTHFEFVPNIVYVQFFDKNGQPESWTHPEVPGTHGVYPVRKTKCVWHVAGNKDQRVRRYQLPLVPGLSSTIHIAQGSEMVPIIELDSQTTPTLAYVAVTRTHESRKCIIIDNGFDFGLFGLGHPLNFQANLLLMKLRGDPAYQEHLGNFTSHKAKRASAVKQRAGAIGSRKRKAVGGESGDHARKGGSAAQQKAAGRSGGQNACGDVKAAAGRIGGQIGGQNASHEDKAAAGHIGGQNASRDDKAAAGRKASRDDKAAAGHIGGQNASHDDKIAAGHEGGQQSGRARGAAAARKHGYNDADILQRGTKRPGRAFAHIAGRIELLVGKSVARALATNVPTTDGLSRCYTRRELQRDLTSGYLVRAQAHDTCEADVSDLSDDGDRILIPTDDASDADTRAIGHTMPDTSPRLVPVPHVPAHSDDGVHASPSPMDVSSSDADSAPSPQNNTMHDMGQRNNRPKISSRSAAVKHMSLKELLQAAEDSPEDYGNAHRVCDAQSEPSTSEEADEDEEDDEIDKPRCKFLDEFAGESDGESE